VQTENISISQEQLFDNWQDNLIRVGTGCNGIVFKRQSPIRPSDDLAFKFIVNYGLESRHFHEVHKDEGHLVGNLPFYQHIVQMYAELIFVRPPEEFNHRMIDPTVVDCTLHPETKVSRCWQVLVQEYFPITLEKFLEGCNSGPMLLRFCYEITLPIAFLFKNRIVHRDVKLNNFLLSSFGTVVLCDFGEAREVNNHMILELDSDQSSFGGSVIHLAPEVLNPKKGKNGKLIVSYQHQPSWELGVLFLEIALKMNLTDSVSDEQRSFGFLCQRMDELNRLHPSIKYPRKFLQLIVKCLSHNPTQRPSLDKIKTELLEVSTDAFMIGITSSPALPISEKPLHVTPDPKRKRV
jgi:hypothetical protein